MARRRRGAAIHGWLLIDKPVGVGSTDVVSAARRALGAQKAGHAGTLDPLASGLLAVAFGEATKTVPVAQEGLKTYRFTVRLGQARSTDDAEGEVTAESEARPTDAEIEAALPAFRGNIAQVPPLFSAVKVAGQRAYDIARGGDTAELAARPLHVARLDLIERSDADHAVLEMTCGRGGYVRSIARDLGEVLGCHGHVAVLRRLASGTMRIEDAIPFAALDAIRDGTCDAPLLPIEAGLAGLEEIALPEAAAARVLNGNAAPAPGPDRPAWASAGGRPLAIGRIEGGAFHPSRVFRL